MNSAVKIWRNRDMDIMWLEIDKDAIVAPEGICIKWDAIVSWEPSGNNETTITVWDGEEYEIDIPYEEFCARLVEGPPHGYIP
jgi:hypothetical protein